MYQPGDRVLVLCEYQVEHRVGEWLGRFFVVRVYEEAKVILVQQDTDSPIQGFTI